MSTTSDRKGSTPAPGAPAPPPGSQPGPQPTPRLDHTFVRGYMSHRGDTVFWVSSYVRRRPEGEDGPLTPDELERYKAFLEAQVTTQKTLADKDSNEAAAIGEKLKSMDADDPDYQKMQDQQKADNAESFRHRQAAAHLEDEVRALPKGSEPQPDPDPKPEPIPNKPGHG